MSQTESITDRHSRSRKPRFKVGDSVQLVFMSKTVSGRIVENRGEIGLAGHHLYRVEAQTGSVTRVLELSDEQLQPFH